MIELFQLQELDVNALKSGDEVNLIIGTPIEDLIDPIFGPLEEGEPIFRAPENLDWPHLLAFLLCFPSASQAAKNWRSRNLDLEITPGCTEISIGKARRIWIYVWKVLPESG